MTRVLAVSDLWLPFPGGAERLMFNLCRALIADGHDVKAITGYENAQRFDGPHVWRREIDLDERGWQIIDAAITASHAEVLLVHHVYARTFHDELVATGLPIVQVVLNGERMIEAALAVFISEHVRSRALALHGDLTIMPWAERDVVSSTHGDAVGFVKPIEHKGVDLFYEIVERLPQYRYVVLRGEWQNLERIVEHPSVEFMQPVVDMREFWRECRCALVPSISEDAGTIAQEATANGLPCISSTVDGLAETNAGGMRLSRDLDAWCAALQSLDNERVVAALVDSQQRHEQAARRERARRLSMLSQAIRAL